jgi:hypothetical protein
MTEHTPRAIAVAFTKAWSSHNLTSAAAYLAEDVVFDGPGGHSVGARAYLEGLTPFAQRTTGMRIIAALDDDDQALIMYEVTIGPSVTVTCAEHLTIRDGEGSTPANPARRSLGRLRIAGGSSGTG